MPSSLSSSGKSSSRQLKSSIVVTLRLPSAVLAGFPQGVSGQRRQSHSITSAVDSKSELDESSANTPKPSDGNDRTSLAPPDDASKKANGVKAGTKRQSSALDPTKPGPKKKAKVADDRATPTTKKSHHGTAVGGTHKGPRANTGAINAGLRALDRSGKPCRRWDKKGFQLKSFTGIQWSLGSWNAPRSDLSSFPGDVKSDASSSVGPEAPVQGNASDSSNTGDNAHTPAMQSLAPGSSPAPILA